MSRAAQTHHSIRCIARLALGACALAACEDSLSASVVLCSPRRVGIQSSGALILGRRMGLSAAGYRHSGLPIPLAAAFESSDESVLQLDGDSAVAAGLGSATLYATVCGMRDSIPVEVLASGYSVTTIHADGPGPITASADMNDLGQVIVRLQGPPGYLWDEGTTTELLSCDPITINDAGQVLCNGGGPVIWENGQATARDTFSAKSVDLNDHGHVLMPGLVWRGPGDVAPFSMTGIARVKALNNTGNVLATSTDFHFSDRVLDDGTWKRLPTTGRLNRMSALNDSGDVGGWMEGEIGSDGIAYYGRRSDTWAAQGLRPPGPLGDFPPQDWIAREVRAMNNHDALVGTGSHGPWVWTSGQFWLLNDVIADTNWVIVEATRINDQGQILARGYHRSQATSGASVPLTILRLDPP